MTIKNIIFDLGNVIIDVDRNLTIEAFAKLANFPLSKAFELFTTYPQNSSFELGKLSAQEYFEQGSGHFNFNCSEIDFWKAWNAMLLNIPTYRLERMKELKKNYKIYILSNTNIKHIEKINEMLPCAWNEFSHKTYFSYDYQMIKPDLAFYEVVLQENDLKACETMFLDDLPENIEAATKLNLKTQLIRPENFTMIEATDSF
ncbi:MAG: HAD family hydrolase [Bacteriovoracia bacterium]